MAMDSSVFAPGIMPGSSSSAVPVLAHVGVESPVLPSAERVVSVEPALVHSKRPAADATACSVARKRQAADVSVAPNVSQGDLQHAMACELAAVNAMSQDVLGAVPLGPCWPALKVQEDAGYRTTQTDY